MGEFLAGQKPQGRTKYPDARQINADVLPEDAEWIDEVKDPNTDEWFTVYEKITPNGERKLYLVAQ